MPRWTRGANESWQLSLVSSSLGISRPLKTCSTIEGVRGLESMVAAAVQWAERIMRKIDSLFPAGR
jgi:hypothetical protein